MTRAWDGRVCDAPLANSSCLTLKLIAEKRRDDVEDTIAGEAFEVTDAVLPAGECEFPEPEFGERRPCRSPAPTTSGLGSDPGEDQRDHLPRVAGRERRGDAPVPPS